MGTFYVTGRNGPASKIVGPVAVTGDSATPDQLAGVPFKEYVAKGADPYVSPHASFARDETKLMRVYDVAWKDYQQAVRGLLGYATVKIGLGGSPYISRQPPDDEPDLERLDPVSRKAHGSSFLFAHRVGEMTGHAVPDDKITKNPITFTARANIARLRVEYSTSLADWHLTDGSMTAGGYVDEFDNPSEASCKRAVTKLVKSRHFYQNIPAGANLVIVPADPVTGSTAGRSNVSLPTPPGRIFPGFLVTLVHHNVPEASVGMALYNPTLTGPGAIDVSLGKLNHFTFLGYPGGTCLLEAADVEPHTSPVGDRVFDVHLSISIVFPGHNWLPTVIDASPPAQFGFGYSSVDDFFHFPSYAITATDVATDQLTLDSAANYFPGQTVTVDRTLGGVTEREIYYVGRVEVVPPIPVYFPLIITLYDTKANAVAGGVTGRVDVTADLSGKVRIVTVGNSLFDYCNFARLLEPPKP